MAYTHSKIATYTVGSGGVASINFLNIPQIYTDLLVKISARNATNTETVVVLFFNNDTTESNYRSRRLIGSGSSVGSASYSNPYFYYTTETSDTASTFANGDIYIPNYAGFNYKSISIDSVSETNNAASVETVFTAGLWSKTEPINSIQIRFYPAAGVVNFAQYSTFQLYGIKAEV